MMPGVLSPRLRIAIGVGVYPVIDWRGGRTQILGVIPCAGPAVALESKEHGVAAGQRLIHVHFDVGDGARRTIEVNPAVVDEIAGIGVVAEGGVVEFAAVPRVGGIELEGTARDRW